MNAKSLELLRIGASVLGCFSLLALSFHAVFAQSSSPAFEVASIKPSDPNKVRNVTIRNGPGGGLNINDATLKLLIELAYDVRDFQILGGPGWIKSDRYDIAAKAEPDVSLAPTDQRKAMEQQRERLRALLADRFQLKVRRETKKLPVYALTPAKGGPKLKVSNLETPAPGPNSDKGPQSFRGSFMRMRLGQIMGQSASLDLLVEALTRQLGRAVIDKTSLKGTYDFKLEWTPDPAQSLGPGFGGPGEPSVGREPPPSDSPAPTEPNGPSLFVALKEQLGLKLQSQKAPIEIIVIESVQKPSEN